MPPEMKWDLEFLYTRKTIPEVERFLRILLDRYETSTLMPLLNAWHNLKAYWQITNMSLTNNAREQLYSAITPRRRKRDKHTEVRQKAYLAEIIWRHNHNLDMVSPLINGLLVIKKRIVTLNNFGGVL